MGISESDYSVKTEFKSWYLGIMGLFYLGQGYALSSLVVLLPLYIIKEFDESRAAAVTISAIIIFPWYIKFLFGIISDYFPIGQFGRRKPYLVIATIFSIAGWTTLGIHSSLNLAFITSGVLLAIGSALGDSVIDGQAVEITPTSYIGRLQGVAWASRGLGIGSAGVVSAQIVESLGWQAMFNVAAIFGISITIVVLILPQSPIEFEYNGREQIRYLYQTLKDVLTKKRNSPRVGFFLLSGIVIAIVPLLSIIMEREFLYSIGEIGYGALYFALGSFIGAILLGIITDKHDTLQRFLILSICLSVTILVGLFFVNTQPKIVESGYLALIGIFAGAYEAYQLRVIQEETTPNYEGSMFALWTGVSNIGQFIFGGVIIIQLAEFLDISIFTVMQLLVLPIILGVFVLKSLKFSSL